MDDRQLPPALLVDATWYGTLAAMRNLGSHGVPVTLGSDSRLAPARWSRIVHRTLTCPATKDTDRFMEWLRDFGEREPGHVLNPTSDDLAWNLSLHRQELSRYFKLFSPPAEALARILDKRQLTRGAQAAGVPVPETWFPESEADVERIAREAPFPLFVKPCTQLLARGIGKGTRVDRREALLAAWRNLRDRVQYYPEVRAKMPGVELPIIQAFHSGSESVYSVDGFIDETGELFSVLACSMILQRPRGSGIGIIFEHTTMDPSIAEGIRRFCRTAGFYGVFDIEFVEHQGSQQLIDFNPRHYNHIAFEIDRGLPLPWLAYLSALGDRSAVAGALAQVPRVHSEPHVYVHRLPVALMLRLQALTGAMTRAERQRWRVWLSDHRKRVTDPVRGNDSFWPSLAELLMEFNGFARHPRSYLRRLLSAGPSVSQPRPTAGGSAPPRGAAKWRRAFKALSGDHSPLAMPWMRVGRGSQPVDDFHRAALEAEWELARTFWVRFSLIARALCWPAASLARALKLLRSFGLYVTREHGISRVRQLFQIIATANRDNIGPDLYYSLQLFRPERRCQAALYMTEPERKWIGLKLITRFDNHSVDNKIGFFETSQKLGLPVAPVLAVFEGGRLQRSYQPLPQVDLLLKPGQLSSGRGIECWQFDANARGWKRDAQQLDESAFVAHACEISRQCQYLVQARVISHPDLSCFSSFGLCTLRVVTTYLPGDNPGLVLLYFRMPIGHGVVDNFDAGNLAAMVDPATGRLSPAVTSDIRRGVFHYHPITGAAIAGQELPHWQEMVAAARAACVHFPNFRTLGWDVAMSPQGPIILEANTVWGDASQNITGRPLGLDPVISHLLENLRRPLPDGSAQGSSDPK